MRALPQLSGPANTDLAEKSKETVAWLRNHVKVGFTSERGPAWWDSGLPDGSHFPEAVPMAEVTAMLDVPLVKGTAYVSYDDLDGDQQVVRDDDNIPVVNQRDGTIFGYPKEGYKIHPYSETLSGFMKKIAFDEDVAVSSVGLLRNSGVAFLQVVLPETLEVAGYPYVPYLAAVTSADRSRSSTYVTGIKAAVCGNTLDQAIAEALTKLRIPHTRHSGESVAGAREKLGIQLAAAGQVMGDVIEQLTAIDISDRQLMRWMDLAVPLVKPDGTPKTKNAVTVAENKRNALLELWNHDPKVKPWSGTAFGVLQMDNTWRTWEGQVKPTMTPGGRFERNLNHDMLGGTGTSDAKALERLAKVLRRKTLIAA